MHRLFHRAWLMLNRSLGWVPWAFAKITSLLIEILVWGILAGKIGKALAVRFISRTPSSNAAPGNIHGWGRF